MNLPATPVTYEGQLAAHVAELLPHLDTAERLELLDVMDADDMRTSLAFIVSMFPQAFDFALVRDRALVERLETRLDESRDGEDQPHCAICGAGVSIFRGHGDSWHHWRGEGTADSPVELYDADHAPKVAWGPACAVPAAISGRDSAR